MREELVEATKPPYVVMECVGCGKQYKIGPRPGSTEHPFCPKDYMPLATIKAVGR